MRQVRRIPFGEFVRGILPYGRKGCVLMLRAYIDDSGTHDDSSAVVMGALIAPDEKWALFDLDWCATLDAYGVDIFHMSACEAGDRPFDWPRAKRDALVHDLREVIIKNEIHGTSAAISKKDWDELVIGEHRENLGDAVEMALGASISAIVNWSRQFFNSQPIAVVIDNQENRIGALQNILNQYHALQERFPELVSATFGAMRAFTPLQGADMLAWESYRNALDWFKTGGHPNPRPHFQRFLERGYIAGLLLDRNGIERAIQDYELITPYPGPFEGGSLS